TPRPRRFAGTWSSTELLLHEDEGVVFGIAHECDRRSAGHVERFAVDGAAELGGEGQRRLQVAHLHVERHARTVALLQVTRRTRFGPAEAGADVHDRAVADRPIEELGVEGALPFRV